MYVQMCDEGYPQERANAQLIDIVEDAGYVGFEILVRALAKNDQERLAKQLDEDLASKFIRKLSPEAGMLLLLLFSLSVVI